MPTFAISDRDVSRLELETNWPTDCPIGWEAISAAPRRRVGRGYSRRVTMNRAEAWDLAAYLWDAAGASAAAADDSGGEAGGWQRRLLARVDAALEHA